MTPEDVLDQLLDEELETEVMLAQRLSSSPPQALPLTQRLTPLRKAHRAPTTQDAVLLMPHIVINKVPSPESHVADDSTRSVTQSQKLV